MTETLWVPGDRIRQLVVRIDSWLVARMERYGETLLRFGLGIVFIWFGLLKVIGASPVAGLVTATVPWIPAGILVPGLGVFEMAVGAGLMIGRWMRVVLGLFWLQMVGTLALPVLHPEVVFQGSNPLLLTTEGEFVVKNLVLIAAGIVLGGAVTQPWLGEEVPPEEDAPRDQGSGA